MHVFVQKFIVTISRRKSKILGKVQNRLTSLLSVCLLSGKNIITEL
jgi:hypothetical protein